ncbi:hypothetical protein [Lentzea xinjiangensis]|nr:hypothetical protein [Lentzea xinjiangensis]
MTRRQLPGKAREKRAGEDVPAASEKPAARDHNGTDAVSSEVSNA